MEFLIFYVSHVPQEKKVIKIHWEFVWKLKNDVQARCRQATDLSIFLHTSLTGRPKMTKMSFPCSMGMTFLKMSFPCCMGSIKKSNILLEICVKVDFCNTSRARTSFFLSRHDEQHGQHVDFMTSFLSFPSRTSEKMKNLCFFWKNLRRWQNQKCCSHQWWEHQKWWPRQFRNYGSFWRVPPSHYKIRHFFSTLQNTLRFSMRKFGG